MSSLGSYNPAQDGFAAKVWECLRRNSKFRSVIERYLSTPESEQHAGSQLFPYSSDYHIAQIGFEVVTFGSEFSPEHGVNGLPNWNSLSFHYQERLRDAIEPRVPLSEVFWPDEEVNLSEWVKDRSKRSIFVEIPRHVRDTDHRKAILAAIERLVPEAQVNAKRIKPTGSSLGSVVEWDCYLKAQQWAELGFTAAGIRCDLVAYEKFGKEDFGDSPGVRKRAALHFRSAKPKQQKHFATVEKHIEKIESSIASVYPEFNPLVG